MNRLFLFNFLLFLFGCEAPVIFTEPQPTNTRSLNKIPKKLHGSYLNEGNDSYLKIDDNSIQRIHLLGFDSTEMEDNYVMEGNTIYDKSDSISYHVKNINDTLYVLAFDTFFTINNSNILKKYKGYYFINRKIKDEHWEVRKLNLAKGILTINKITSKEEIQKLQQITGNYEDTISPYVFSINKKQFKEFLKNEGFGDSERFVKMKEIDF